ncbi:MAG TPA: nucleotide exchange factor GrpE [Clostridia bacterium]|jgi:molecular chaperone GrpE|nr:nucleotide exchange factor GrpE [Clostridia bacterium]
MGNKTKVKLEDNIEVLKQDKDIISQKSNKLNVEEDNKKTSVEEIDSESLDTETKALIEKLQRDVEEYICVAKKIKAEFDNYRKRNESIIEKSKDEATDKVILDFIEVKDSIDAALMMIKDETSQKGVELINKQFVKVLEKYEIEEINPLNQPFNPELHDAIMQEENESKSGLVTQVFKKGYLKNKKVIRYATVKVAA